jgi:hypothetical protein
MFNFLKIDDNKKKYLAFNLSLIFISLLVIFFSAPHFSYQSYYWFDFTLAQFNHNQNLANKFLHILPNSGNIFGITLWIIEPSLNFLSKFNYNLSNRSDKETEAILKFLDSNAGFKIFEMTLPEPYNKLIDVYCPEWNHTYKFKNNHDVSVKFIEFKGETDSDIYFNTLLQL